MEIGGLGTNWLGYGTEVVSRRAAAVVKTVSCIFVVVCVPCLALKCGAGVWEMVAGWKRRPKRQAVGVFAGLLGRWSRPGCQGQGKGLG